jgi:hypothetical protein
MFDPLRWTSGLRPPVAPARAAIWRHLPGAVWRPYPRPAPPVDETVLETSAIELPAQLQREGTYGWEVEVQGPVAERILGTFWFEVGSGNDP